MGARYPIPGVAYWNAAAAARHVASGAWHAETIGDALRATAARVPDKPAVVTDERSLTFAALDAESESVAAALLACGLAPGARAIFQMGSVADIFPALLGCVKAGIVPVCTLPQYREIEIGQLARLSGAVAYFVQGDAGGAFDQAAFARRMMRELPQIRHLVVARGAARPGELALEEMAGRFAREAARARTAPADPAPEDVAFFQLSGGSTGVPKIIPRFHGEYLGSGIALARRHGLGPDDVALWALPVIHNAGMLFMTVPMIADGRTTVVLPRFEPQGFLAAIAGHKITFTGSIGPVAPRLIEVANIADYDLSSLRMFFTISRADTLEAHSGVVCGNIYGITEGLLMASAPDAPAEARALSIGQPVSPGDEVRILVPGTEDEVAEGETGELCFRGPHTLTGYFNAPEANAGIFTADGFFRSGDMVRIMRAGGEAYYVFEGRLRDNINRGGEKIGAEEVETLVARHPAVSDVRLVAMPDRLYGEKACAFIIPRPGEASPTVEALGRFLLDLGLAKFKLPERVETIEAFPVTRVGKVDKAEMRRLIAAKLAAEEAARAADAA
ncbi:MAG: AMP-binding protein [Rhodospirillaceae bacterium]|nr:AMP-binding protein [Rhodospirillaceae bacterium]